VKHVCYEELAAPVGLGLVSGENRPTTANSAFGHADMGNEIRPRGATSADMTILHPDMRNPPRPAGGGWTTEPIRKVGRTRPMKVTMDTVVLAGRALT
jgi:hypothetical protein